MPRRGVATARNVAVAGVATSKYAWLTTVLVTSYKIKCSYIQPIGRDDANGRRTESTKTKERQMASIKIISQKLDAWRRYRQTLRELSAMTDRELHDIGIDRCDIESIAHASVAA